MISKETIDKIFETAQIEEVVGDFVNLKKRGSNYAGLSPFTNEKTPSFYEDGMIWSETHFNKGQKDGATTTWYPNGIKRYTGQYKMEQQAGKWVYYDETGKIAEEKVYK